MPSHRHQTTQKIAEMGWEVLTHPPYSPLNDFHLFGPVKESLGGIQFQNDDAVKQHVVKGFYIVVLLIKISMLQASRD